MIISDRRAGPDLPLKFDPVAFKVRVGRAVRPNFGPPITRVLRLFHGGGLDAPAWFCSKIGGLLPIAPWGRSSL